MRIARYQNGNAWVEMYDDGTRIIETHGDEPFDFEYPLNNDITITHKCDGGCPFCYLGCTPNGKHADILNFSTPSYRGRKWRLTLTIFHIHSLRSLCGRCANMGCF